MAKAKKEVTIPKAETKIKQKKVELPSKHHYFPRLRIFFGILLIVIAVVDYLQYYTLPKIVIDAILLIAGLWMLYISFEKGFYKRRKEVLKKYI